MDPKLKAKITAVAEATDRICASVEVARWKLDHFDGRIFNGFGYFYDPSSIRSDLDRAHNSIAEALKEMRSTSWPTRQELDDYDG